MAYQSKTTRFFLRFFVRKPIGYFLVTLIGVFLLVILFLSVRVPSVTTLTVKTSSEADMCTLMLEDPITEKQIDKLYVYEDRNSFVFEIDDYDITDNKIVFYITKGNAEPVFNSEQCYLEVWSGDHSLLYELVVQGGN